MVPNRKIWILRNGFIAIILIFLWNTVLVRPLRVLLVLFHEIFHALSALLTGGGINTIEVTSYETGLTSLYGGFSILVYSAGYIGTAFLGSLLLVSGQRYPLKRALYLGIGLLLLVNTIIFVGNPFGWAYGLVVGFFFVLLFFKEFWFSVYITDLIGILCIIDVLYDFLGFLKPGSRNDAFILYEITGIPYLFILITWIVMSLTMFASTIYFSLKNLVPEKLEEHLEWAEFKFVTRSFIERGNKMLQESEKEYKRKSRSTIIVYLSILGVIVLIALYSSRFVLFQPWTAREWVTAAVVEEKIYVAGGRDRQGLTYGQILRIDPKRLKIHEVTDLPSPRFGMGAASLKHRAYFLGGFDGRKCFAEVFVLDPQNNELHVLGRLPSPRTFGGVTVSSGKIYYMGGWDGSKQLDEIVVIDPESGDSQIIGHLSSPREFVTAVTVSGKLYLFGGSDHRGQYLDEILEIDPASGQIIRKGHLPAQRIRSSATISQDKIFLIGGWEGKKVDEILMINPGPQEIKVELFTKLPRGFSDIAVVTLENNIFLVGGTHEKFQRQISVIRVDLESGESESLKFRSFLFW